MHMIRLWVVEGLNLHSWLEYLICIPYPFLGDIKKKSVTHTCRFSLRSEGIKNI